MTKEQLETIVHLLKSIDSTLKDIATPMTKEEIERVTETMKKKAEEREQELLKATRRPIGLSN